MKVFLSSFINSISCLIISCSTVYGQASQSNVITTAVPFLRICPDARSGGIGETGIASFTGANSIFYNSSLLAFAEDEAQIAATFNPWLRELFKRKNAINLFSLAGYYKLGNNGVLGTSSRFFDLRTLIVEDTLLNVIGAFKANELAWDIAYSQKLAEHLSGGIAVRYIRSNLGRYEVNGIQVHPGSSIAADISLSHQLPVSLFKKDAVWSTGLCISNIGSKLAYTNQRRDFIPTNFGIGTSLKLNFSLKNSLTLLLDANKLMVPTPAPPYTQTPTVMGGMFQSFSDAPGGLREELQEITYGIGLEAELRSILRLRGGYFHESPYKGDREYTSFGMGLRIERFALDFSYWFSSNSLSPLKDTWKISVSYAFGKKKKTDKLQQQ